MTEEQARGVHLTDKQIVFSVMAATVVAVVVFLCGVFVGRGVQALRPASADAGIAENRVVPDTTAPVPESDSGGVSAGESGGPVTAVPDKLTYYERLGKAEPPNESLAALSESGPPEPPPDAPDSAADTTASAPGTRTPVAPVPKPAAAVVPPAATAGPAAKPAPAVTAAGPSDTDGAGPYTVQLFAVTRKVEAQSLVSSVQKKGFPAFVFTPPPGDPRGGFRVRVGSFKSRQEAAAMASRLQKAGYSPWIIR